MGEATKEVTAPNAQPQDGQPKPVDAAPVAPTIPQASPAPALNAGSKENAEGFDYRTTIKDPKTNEVIAKNDYKMVLEKDGQGNTSTKIERPIGSGKFFHPNGHRIEILGSTQKQVEIDKDGHSKAEFDKLHAGK